MKMIEAVIKPYKLDAVKNALAMVGVHGMTVIECKGFGRQLGHNEQYRGATLEVAFVPKVLVKVCVNDNNCERTVTAIRETARTGEVGDGKIFVYPVSTVVRIRTGEQDDAAL